MAKSTPPGHGGRDASEARSPSSGRQSPDPTTRETILSLVEMLLQNSDSNGLKSQLPSFEDDRDVPSVDEHLQIAGAEVFNQLQRRINNLDKELRNFANAARQLGSSVAILSSAFHLRERLALLLFLYHENAADLFPRKISHIVKETPTDLPAVGLKKVRGKARLHVPRPTVPENVDPESFPEQLEFLAKEVTTFLRCLNEFPEFTDEAVNASILSFEGDLKYWSSCLKEYSGQFRYPAVQRYIHELSSELGGHIDELTSSLSMFIEIGVPTIRFAQKHGADNLLNLSTVATFFSAVTATTLQFSYALERSSSADSVNCFWFASMVFSIAAAVNSLLGLTWKQAMYRSPGHRVPWWVLIWIKRSPLVFLVLSVACFSVGLCCFAYASHQAHITSTITTVLTAFTSFGLAAVSAWFASERWAFSRHRGQKWLSDILSEANDRFLQLPGMIWLSAVVAALLLRLLNIGRAVAGWGSQVSARVKSCRTRSWEDDDLEASVLPTTSPVTLSTVSKEPVSPRKQRTPDATTTIVTDFSTSPLPPPVPVNSPIETDFGTDSPPELPSITTAGKRLWKNAVKNVQMRGTLSPPTAPTVATVMTTPRSEPIRKRTISSGLSFPDKRYTRDSTPYVGSRLSNLVPKLVELEVTHDLAAHTALVRHMQFSPDGRFLATSSWDKTSLIFEVAHPFKPHRTLLHPHGFVGQVAWSPSGRYLLTKTARGVKLWTADNGVCKKTINRPHSVEAVVWCPDDISFLIVEESVVIKMDLQGKTLDEYLFADMKLHDVAITPDSQRILGVGPLLRSPTGLQPSKSKVEKRIVVYNVEAKQIESMTPILEEVRDITIATSGRHSGHIALVSYENKAPPQLWKLEFIKDKTTNAITTSRLILRHTYMPKVPVDFAGPSYFGGKNNELILCAGKAGDIHVWDQESGALLHLIRAQSPGGDLTCIAWNHAATDPFMFATGSHDGGVRVWTRHPDDDLYDDHTPTHIQFTRTSSPDRLGSLASGSTVSVVDPSSDLHASHY
ncbi:hypothetical protein D9619_008077 [Psilocybe cf. subviscida]|uniref:Uncharacterized protein n=1 Tax=Psilocybe cf. subviscida TaxID=2480587 RepID=A0A8H5AUE3_9AGAR|nr:hypothetical protein D9619_008077 [Psilocybe cf. subviscida]